MYIYILCFSNNITLIFFIITLLYVPTRTITIRSGLILKKSLLGRDVVGHFRDSVGLFHSITSGPVQYGENASDGRSDGRTV